MHDCIFIVLAVNIYIYICLCVCLYIYDETRILLNRFVGLLIGC